MNAPARPSFPTSAAGPSSSAAAAAPPSASGGESAAELVHSLNSEKISFESGSSDLTDTDRTVLQQAAARLKALPAGTVIDVTGHTDNTGDAAANTKLSQERADLVRAFLVQNGVAADRLVAKGFGSTQPIASNDTEEGRAQNRRIEYRLEKHS